LIRIVHLAPILSWREMPARICNKILRAKRRDPRILHAASIELIFLTRTEHRRITATHEMESVLTLRQAKADTMLDIMTCRAIEKQNSAGLLLQDRRGVGDHQGFPRVGFIRT